MLRSHRIAIGLYDRTKAGLVRRHRLETDVAGPRTLVPELVGQPRPDLVPGQRRRPTYAKIRLDDHSLSTLIESIAAFTDLLPAALCWAAAWDMCRDAEMAARDYLRLVLSGISSVADISVMQTLLQQASGAVRRFADPQWRQTGLRLLADALRGLLGEAAPGRTPSWPSSARSPASPAPPRTLRCWPACSTARWCSTASPSTPTCAGRCYGGW